MPPKAYTYAIPYKYYKEDKIRRYGFHGTSHRYVTARAAELIGKPVEELKLITCHMGNGSSICAVDGGKSVDTSMGFTPLAGLPMGTRVGDIDAGIMEYIMNKYDVGIKEMMNILNKKSGVLGVSERSSDFRDLINARDEGNAQAGEAVEIFCYDVAKTIGSYVVALGGVDAIIFTAGIGENSNPVREGVCKYLGAIGAVVDPEKNKTCRGEMDISTADSKVKLWVIPTNEELVIARDTKKIAEK
jgi:acetate kinase